MRIYLLRNNVNGKCYVGQTIEVSLSRRLSKHRTRGHGLIGKAIRKHGWEAFSAEVVETCTDREDLDMAERFWIKTYNSLAPNGYNLETGGNAQKRLSEETRRRLSQAGKGRITSDETKRRMSATRSGRAPTAAVAAHRLAISEGRYDRRGERAGNARLTWDAVHDIRLDPRAAHHLALKHGVSVSCVHRIRRGEMWIEEPA